MTFFSDNALVNNRLYKWLSTAIFLVDQVTKFFALDLGDKTVHINNFLSFTLVFNRGISWGYLNYKSAVSFIVLNALIMTVLWFLVLYIKHRIRHNKSVFGSILVLAGASSNMFDRILRGGVVDFISFSWGDFQWPVFNLADVFIVIGVGMMLYTVYTEK